MSLDGGTVASIQTVIFRLSQKPDNIIHEWVCFSNLLLKNVLRHFFHIFHWEKFTVTMWKSQKLRKLHVSDVIHQG